VPRAFHQCHARPGVGNGRGEELTDRPFGVDLLTASPVTWPSQVELVIEGGASVFVAGLGVPSEVVELLPQERPPRREHVRQGPIMRGVQSTLVCDLVVAQGTEAGGHTGLVATDAPRSQIVDAVGDRIPVVAAGGIVDGRGLAAALALGADRRVDRQPASSPTPEARSVSGYKEALIAARKTRRRSAVPIAGKTMPGRAKQLHGLFDKNPLELGSFPEQLPGSMQDGAVHLGAGNRCKRVSIRARVAIRPDRAPERCEELIPAGELVAQIVRRLRRSSVASSSW